MLHVTRAELIRTLLSFDVCMCIALLIINLKAVFSSLAFLNVGCPFAVTARTKNMSLKSWGASDFKIEN